VFLNDAFGRVGRIIPPMIISALFLGQPQGLGTVVGGICVIIAVILPGKFSKDDLKGTGKKRALYAIAFILLCTSSTMCVKMYVELQSPEDLISFCLFTNIFIAITSVISLIAEIPRGNVRKEIQLLGKWHYLFIIILAVGSNVTAYVDSFMLEYVDVIKNTIITSSIGIVVTLLVTGINKEKITIRHIISACLSLVSVIFPLFF
jgi:drug/metabolite transporter (DMT)-like permease